MHIKSLQWCPTLCHSMDYSLPGSCVHGDSPHKSTGVDCHALLQGIFPTQGSNPRLLYLLHWQAGSSPLGSSGQAQANPWGKTDAGTVSGLRTASSPKDKAKGG